MKRALISDIHSNIESLDAVMADIREQGIDGNLSAWAIWWAMAQTPAR